MSVAVDAGKNGLAIGRPAVKSVGALTFGPDGILFVADNLGASIFAIDVDDTDATRDARPVNVENLDTRLAAYLGCAREDIFIKDMAVHPASHNVYLSVMRGNGDVAMPLLVRLGADGVLNEVPLDNVPYSQVTIDDAASTDDERADGRVVRGDREGAEKEMPSGIVLRIARDRLRTIAVTDMAYVDGVLLVAGASNEEFSSTLRRIPFPFGGPTESSSLEIYHVSHSRYETAAPIRTFLPYGGNTSILASYTCTPVVHFSLNDLGTSTQLKGKTVAELGSGNTPVDIVSYDRDGEEYLLVSNTRHPLMKIACKDIDRAEPLTQPKEPRGVPREELPQQGVGHMANLNGSYVLMMQQDEAQNVHLRSYSSASL
ncbi:MAG: hypothetical protein HW416_529 [Chloroflexi bacterium]|nr:hypothetical protein [Chloroflexota bacterium]